MPFMALTAQPQSAVADNHLPRHKCVGDQEIDGVGDIIGVPNAAYRRFSRILGEYRGFLFIAQKTPPRRVHYAGRHAVDAPGLKLGGQNRHQRGDRRIRRADTRGTGHGRMRGYRGNESDRAVLRKKRQRGLRGGKMREYLFFETGANVIHLDGIKRADASCAAECQYEMVKYPNLGKSVFHCDGIARIQNAGVHVITERRGGLRQAFGTGFL